MRQPQSILIEYAARRDRAIVWLALVGLCAIAWQYTYHHASMLSRRPEDWNPLGFWGLSAMWAVMMIAMMVPTASPAILTYVMVSRKRLREAEPLLPTGLFLAGYVVAWSLFSILAAGLQVGLHRASALSHTMSLTNAYGSAAVLAVAGLFQWSRLKTACLTHCRSPALFLAEYWREGSRGALEMGVRHGLFCIGCCWALMAVLFVTGVMHLGWMTVLTVLMIAEKILPPKGATLLRHTTGSLLVLTSAVLIARSLSE